jgi:tRNA(Ile)-lysidine synthetase-like protein
MMTVISKLLHAINHHRLILPEQPLVVAVSGGTDSVALLHMLHTLRYRLHVATLDHGLRGEAGAADADFVRQIAAAWRLPVTVGRVALDPHAPGVEARAREARYQFLTETAQMIGADRIATAHHADDQAETVLMHLIRGGGIHGLGGMRYSVQLSALSPQPSALHLIRPMLGITRAEIVTYCLENNLAYRHDATNDEPETLRNRLRLQTLPHLRELNPQIAASLNRLAEIASAEDDYLEKEAKGFIQAHGTMGEGQVTLHLAAYRALHLALQRRVLARCATIVSDHPPLYGFEHIDAAASLTHYGQVGALALLPGKLRVRMGYDVLYIEREDTPQDYHGLLLSPGTDLNLKVPGETLLPDGWRIRIEVNPAFSNDIHLTIPVNADLTLRTRRPGDRLKPRGMKGKSRKLKDWMIDRKIPQALRDSIPLLFVNGELAAVLFHPEFYVTETFDFSYNPEMLHYRSIHVTVAKI